MLACFQTRPERFLKLASLGFVSLFFYGSFWPCAFMDSLRVPGPRKVGYRYCFVAIELDCYTLRHRRNNNAATLRWPQPFRFWADDAH